MLCLLEEVLCWVGEVEVLGQSLGAPVAYWSSCSEGSRTQLTLFHIAPLMVSACFPEMHQPFLGELPSGNYFSFLAVKCLIIEGPLHW